MGQVVTNYTQSFSAYTYDRLDVEDHERVLVKVIVTPRYLKEQTSSIREFPRMRVEKQLREEGVFV